MNRHFSIFAAACACSAFSSSLFADGPSDPVTIEDPHPMVARPDAHAPLGVMFDHAHGKGEIMLGYRYFFMRDEGLLRGDESISTRDAFRTENPVGGFYTAAPVSMDMHMHMPEIMWAPADWFTLMVMPMHMEMNMTMERLGDGGHGHGEEHGHGHGDPGVGETSTMTHSTAGWSDTNLSALVPVWSSGAQKAIFILGLNVPTGSVDEKMHGRFTHYMMQLGSGTWDLRPGLTYTGHQGALSWGGQALGTIRLETENSSGYQLGNVVDLTAWTAYRILDPLSLSGRLAWRAEGDLDKHYNGPHNHSSPPDLQGNYGGDRLDAGLGLNFIVPNGALQGHRLAIEALVPLHQAVNGIQLERDWTLVAGWQFAF